MWVSYRDLKVSSLTEISLVRFLGDLACGEDSASAAAISEDRATEGLPSATGRAG
jgi:hypothetical protein